MMRIKRIKRLDRKSEELMRVVKSDSCTEEVSHVLVRITINIQCPQYPGMRRRCEKARIYRDHLVVQRSHVNNFSLWAVLGTVTTTIPHDIPHDA